MRNSPIALHKFGLGPNLVGLVPFYLSTLIDAQKLASPNWWGPLQIGTKNDPIGDGPRVCLWENIIVCK